MRRREFIVAVIGGAAARPLATQVLFALRFADGTTAYTRVQPRLATYGASPAVARLVKERQITGEMPGGDIVAPCHYPR